MLEIRLALEAADTPETRAVLKRFDKIVEVHDQIVILETELRCIDEVFKQRRKELEEN